MESYVNDIEDPCSPFSRFDGVFRGCGFIRLRQNILRLVEDPVVMCGAAGMNGEVNRAVAQRAKAGNIMGTRVSPWGSIVSDGDK